jgi:hypothetical protein
VAVRSHHVEVRRRRFKKKRNIRNTEKQQYSSIGLAIPMFGWAIPASRHAHFQRLPLGLPASLSKLLFIPRRCRRSRFAAHDLSEAAADMHHHIGPTMTFELVAHFGPFVLLASERLPLCHHGPRLLASNKHDPGLCWTLRGYERCAKRPWESVGVDLPALRACVSVDGTVDFTVAHSHRTRAST